MLHYHHQVYPPEDPQLVILTFVDMVVIFLTNQYFKLTISAAIEK